MAPKFCCCIPVRAGTIIISCIQFLLFAIVAAAYWFGFTPKGVFAHASTGDKIASGITALIYTVTAMGALFGFFGAIKKGRKMVHTYAFTSKIILSLFIISGVISLVLFFLRSKESIIADCLESSDGNDTAEAREKLCNSSFVWVRVIYTVLIVVPVFLQAYAVYVVSAYARQLDVRAHTMPLGKMGGDYDRVYGHDDIRPLTHSDGHYVDQYAVHGQPYGHGGV